MRYMPRSSHSFQFDHSSNIGWEIQIISHHNARKIICDFVALEKGEEFRCCRSRGLSGSTTRENSLSLLRHCAVGDFPCDASAAHTTCRILPQNTRNLLLKKGLTRKLQAGGLYLLSTPLGILISFNNTRFLCKRHFWCFCLKFILHYHHNIIKLIQHNRHT